MSFLEKIFGPHRPKDWRHITEKIAAATRKRLGVKAEIRWGEGVDSTSILITWPDGADQTLFVSNFYLVYQNNPSALSYELERFLRSMSQIHHQHQALGHTPDIRNVYPVLKNTRWLEAAEEIKRRGEIESGKTQQPTVARVLAGDLVLTLVQDLPDSMAFMNEDDWQKTGVTDRETLWQEARANLHRHARPLWKIATGEGLFAIRTDGFYDATQILFLTEIITAFNLPAHLAVAVPARNELLLANADKPDTVAHLRELSQLVTQQSPYLVSENLYRWDNQQLSLFDPA